MTEMVHREERQHMRGSEDQSKTGHKQHWSHFDQAMLAGDQAGQPPQKQRTTGGGQNVQQQGSSTDAVEGLSFLFGGGGGGNR